MGLSRMAVRYYRITTPAFSTVVGVRDYVVISAGPSLAHFRNRAVDAMFAKIEIEHKGEVDTVPLSKEYH